MEARNKNKVNVRAREEVKKRRELGPSHSWEREYNESVVDEILQLSKRQPCEELLDSAF